MEASQSNLEKPRYPHPNSQIIKTPCSKPTKEVPQDKRKESCESTPIKNEESIQDESDNRCRFNKTYEWPYSVHGVVSVYFGDIRCHGTGILVGPNIVLTAGHNLYDFETKIYSDLKRMQFLPGVNDLELPFGPVDVKKYFVSSKYIKERREDYGILILEKSIGEKTGYFGLACLGEVELEKKTISVIGYPSDKVESTAKTYELWGASSSVAFIDKDEGLIHYFIDTSQGQSGSGVYYKEGENFYICGVHIRGSRLVNMGALLTRDIYKQIYTWLQEFEGLEYTLAKKPDFFNTEVDPKDVI